MTDDRLLEFVELTGLQAFTRFLSTLSPRNGDYRIWLKLGQNKFFTGEFKKLGDFTIEATRKTKGNRKKTRSYSHAFNYLRLQSEKHDPDGVFYIPTQPSDEPTKQYIESVDDIGCEFDEGTSEEQKQRYQEFYKVTGLEPSSILTSGGKSIHAHWKMDRFYSIDEMNYIRRLFCLGLLSDPAIVNLHQPMRIPGFYRLGKQAEQSLIYVSEARYTYTEVLQGISKWFDHIGLSLPQEITEEYWKGLKRLIAPKKDKKGVLEQLSRSEKYDRLRSEFLSKNVLKSLESKIQLKQDLVFNESHANSEYEFYIDLVSQINASATPEMFTGVDHIVYDGDDHLRCNCPFHASESKNSAFMQKHETTDVWFFCCPICDGKGYFYSDFWRYLEDKETKRKKGQDPNWLDFAKKFVSAHGYIEEPIIYPDELWDNFSELFENLPLSEAISEVSKSAYLFYDEETLVNFLDPYFDFIYSTMGENEVFIASRIEDILDNFEGLTKKILSDRQKKALSQFKRNKKSKERKQINAKLDKSSSFCIDGTFDNNVFSSLFERGNGSITVQNGTFYEYQESNGIWKTVSQSEIAKQINDFAERCYVFNDQGIESYCFANNNHLTSSFNYCLRTLEGSKNPSKDVYLFDLGKRYLGFTNGLLDLKDMKLIPHDPNLGVTVGFDFDYVSVSNLPQGLIDYFLSSFGEEKIPFIRATVKMILDTYNHYPYFVHLIGKSGSGKGSFIRLVSNMFPSLVGQNNHLDRYNDEDKLHQMAKGKRLMISPDISGHLTELGGFYELVDNGKANGRALHSSEAYTKQWYLKFLTASVKPLSTEVEEGFDRRVLYLILQTRKSESKIGFDDYLKQFLPQLVCWALELTNEQTWQIIRDWQKEASVQELKAEVQIKSDSIISFLDTCCYPRVAEDKMVVDENVLYSFYKAFCQHSKNSPKQLQTFIRDLRIVAENNSVGRKAPRSKDFPDLSKKDRDSFKVAAHFVDIMIINELFRFEEYRGIYSMNPAKMTRGNYEKFNEYSQKEDYHPEYGVNPIIKYAYEKEVLLY